MLDARLCGASRPTKLSIASKPRNLHSTAAAAAIVEAPEKIETQVAGTHLTQKSSDVTIVLHSVYVLRFTQYSQLSME